MSQSRTDLSVEFNDIYKFVLDYVKYDFCQKLFINGSRSPKSVKNAREDSDWDFLCVAPKGKYHVATMRERGLHGDMIHVEDHMIEHYSQAVEIWPTDQSGLFLNLGKKDATN